MLQTPLTHPFDFDKWEKQTTTLSEQFNLAKPFPHIVIDHFISEAFAEKLEQSFPGPDAPEWLQYHHVNEQLLASSDIDSMKNKYFSELFDALNSDRFVAWLSQLTGIPSLTGDPTLEGGGLIRTDRGGYLNIHADFTAHPYKVHWRRRINVLLYLNHNWQDQYGGHLELWDKKMKKCVAKVAPLFNRAIIFLTDEHSHHGYPMPLSCPRDVARKSLGLYYYTIEDKPSKAIGTNYQARPEDSLWETAKIGIDRFLVTMYYRFKQRLGLRDHASQRVMKWLHKRKRSS